jgi:hypothetical protein
MFELSAPSCLRWSRSAFVLLDIAGCGGRVSGSPGSTSSATSVGAAGSNIEASGLTASGANTTVTGSNVGFTGGGPGTSGSVVVPNADARPPSCAPGGPGMTNCGPGGTGTESYCTSLVVRGYGYASSDGGPIGLDRATVGGFLMDKYLVTVGRFRQFLSAVLPPDVEEWLRQGRVGFRCSRSP